MPVRIVSLAAHSGTGKTTLAEALLHRSGAISRVGRVEDGTTQSDHTEEEHAHGFSIKTGVLRFKHRDTDITVLDTPGFADFVREIRGGMLGLGIFPGDVVAIRPADVAQNGEVALVLIPGENAGTLKRWQQRGRAVTLHSENPAFEPMRFPVSDVQVQGVLVGHIGLGGARRSARGRP